MFRLIKQNLKGSTLVMALAAPLLMLVECMMDLQQPTLMSDIIDIGVANRNLPYVLATGGRMIAFALIGFAGGASCCALSSFAAMRMSREMRQSLFNKIQSLSFAEIDRFKTSSLITRLTNDITQIQSMFGMLLRMICRSPIICIGGMAMAFMLSPRLALIFCIIVPLLITAIAIVINRSLPLYICVQRCLDRVNTVMRENLLGVRVIKTFNLEGRQAERFEKVNCELTDESIKAESMTFVLMPIVTLVMNLSVVAVLWFGGLMTMSGQLQIGRIMAFVNYLVQITNSLMMVVNLIVNISRAQASGERIKEVMAAEPSVSTPAVPKAMSDFDIEFDQVCFKYEGAGADVLKNLSFTIKEGETVGIIGATGSGKSSLVGLIPRFYDATHGSVRIGGTDVRDMGIDELRSKIGVVLQESLLFSGTIEYNLKFANENATPDEIASALEDAQAAEFVNGINDGILCEVEQRGKNFSGGQKQRLSIARTLLRDSRILILDDSTSAVDLATEARLRQGIASRMERNGLRSTVIIIAQRISGVMDADKIIVLDNGEISAMGTHAELLKQSEIYRSIAVSQLGEEVLDNYA